ncbi:hypothetical protein [Vibrio cidicii]|uniref:hypothetical protein n=1 Tax=Vibrio cidicii TaxID=1763883 RepID=UPI0034E2463A
MNYRHYLEKNHPIENKDFIVFIGQARTNEAGMYIDDYTNLISKVTKNRKPTTSHTEMKVLA